ncbi:MULTISPECIES: hypothetical protein [Croceitalea]|uniref:DUF3955 domain-containing protein n=1 Tax=Croceitalea vernalis TaxID=3075599 RepID=A0ABU3BFB2_9FLAO|nr:MULTISPECIES: hypothetical protein [unclassified Croceitalea]MDT0539068.1 hypothetical protein [Croceitalea sp. P059]MDT0620856.1 hypothetical protein [Croceitalea sp. P007]
MRKTLFIIGLIIALITIIYSFFGMGDTGDFFGIELNIWIYRLIWLVLFGVILKGYLKESGKLK